MIIVFSLTLLLNLVIAPFYNQIEVTSDLQATQTSDINQFTTHSTLATINSNEKLMDRINKRVVKQDSQIKKLDNLLRKQGDTYRYKLAKKEDKWKEITSNEEGTGSRKYSTIYVASPSKNMSKLRIETGDRY